jgi:hypothetical protein
MFSPQVKMAWEPTRTVEQNLSDMGLVYDANKALKIPSAKELLQPMEHDGESVGPDNEISQSAKSYVAKELEMDAKVPRVKNFRLPNNQVTWLTYLIDKYGENYKVRYVVVMSQFRLLRYLFNSFQISSRRWTD